MPEPLDRTAELLSYPTIHLCVDMQRMFAEETEWKTPWMDRVLPQVEKLVRHRSENTIFTRFIPPWTAAGGEGAWCAYFTRWRQFTRSEIDPRLLELVPALACCVPPAETVDKSVYSPFGEGRFKDRLRARGAETLIITGAETDVCVLAAVMSAIDHGYYVVLPKDALCSSNDETHDALIALYARRFSQQIALSDVETIIAAW